MEGLIVNISDEIAQRYHDVEDGLLARIIDKEELVGKFIELFNDFLNKEEKSKLAQIKKSNSNLNYVLHDLSSLIISFYSFQLINNSEIQLRNFYERFSISTKQDFYNIKNQINNDDIFNLISYEKKFQEKDEQFQKYLYRRILNSHIAQSMDGKSTYILNKIIHAYLTNPKQLPDSTIITLFTNYFDDSEFQKLIKGKSYNVMAGILRDQIDILHNSTDDPKYKTTLIRTIVDFIAGMTDSFAINQFNLLYDGEKTLNY